jgi:hypothetical protein
MLFGILPRVIPLFYKVRHPSREKHLLRSAHLRAGGPSSLQGSNMSVAQGTNLSISSGANHEPMPASIQDRSRLDRSRLDRSSLGRSSLDRSSLVRAWSDIALAYGLILATIWTPRPLQQWLYWCAVAWVVFSVWRSFPGWNSLGFRSAGFWRSAWVIGAAVLLAAAAVTVASRLHTLREPRTARGWVMTFGGYVVWSFAQQFLLQSYFLYRFRQLAPSEKLAAVAAAGIFAAAHLPNPILTPITLVWGLCACFVFLRYRNIYPLAVTHAIMGICIAVSVPGPVMHNMRVGLGYLKYHQRTSHPVASTSPAAKMHPR